MSTDIFELADELVKLKLRDKVEAEERVKDINKQIADTERRLADMMVERGVPTFTRGSHRFGADSKTYVSPAQGYSDAVAKWIASEAPALVKPSIHHGTRDSYLRDRFLDDDGCFRASEVPDELREAIKVTTLPTVSVRKA